MIYRDTNVESYELPNQERGQNDAMLTSDPWLAISRVV
jgi:hypothetical protein